MDEERLAKHRSSLTGREREVLALIASGLSNAAIADHLSLSSHTVAWHIRQIFDKLAVKRRTQAVAVARSLGLLDETTSRHASPTSGSGGVIRHNLPIQAAPFFGREDEIAEIARLLDYPTCRLLTLVGPGGIGKTQLAIAVAFRQQHKYSDGVYFVPLEPLTTHEDIAPAIASSIGLTFQPDDRDPQQQLMDYFHSRSMLLLMDNFEHLLAGARFISDLLAAAPGINVMITSRETLNLREEHLNHVGGLQFPINNQSTELPETFGAVELFADRARRVYPEFSLNTELPNVVHICQLVNGIPLALELAATWVNTLSCTEIAGEIQGSLDILATSLRDVPERHRSMQAAFDHSWGLLNDAQRTAFRRLSVFRGGCTREAALEVTGADLKTLQALVDKCFIRRDSQSGRYDIHELLRQYGEVRLEMHPDENEETRGRHTRYYAAFVYQHESSMIYAMDGSVPDKVHPERDNIDRAWRWALEQGMVEELGKFPVVMDYYLLTRGLFAYARAIYSQTAEYLRTQPSSEKRDWSLGRVLTHWGWTLHVQGRNEEAHSLLEEGLPLLNRPEWGYEHALNMGFLGEVKCVRGDLTEARQVLQAALVIFQSLQTPHGIWMTRNMLGTTALQAGELEAARGHFEEALRVAERVKSTVMGYLIVLPSLSITHSALGELEEAKQCLRRVLAINRKVYDTFACSFMLAGIAHYLMAQNQAAEAIEVLTIIAEHPLCSGDIRQQMQPYLEELTSKLPPETIVAARMQVETILESTHQSRNPTFLPESYLNKLQQLLEEPL